MTLKIDGVTQVDDVGGGGGGGGAVTVADGADVNAGSTTDAVVITDATGTLSSKLRGLIKWAFERMPVSLGQKVMTASFPVVVASDQSAIPVSGPLTDVELRATPVPVSGTVSVTEPVTVDATNLDIRDLTFITDKVDASGSSGVGVTGIFFQATQPVSATDLDIRDLAFATDKVDISGSSVDVTDDPTRDLGKVDVASLDQYTPVAGRLPVDGSGVTQPVSATNLDIRDLVFATDKIDVSGSTVAISGTVPISAASLPLPSNAAIETGGNLAAITTALQILDDWDESDRAKVNPIVGQAGVAAGAGAVGTTTQRTTLASDDPAVVHLAAIETAIEGVGASAQQVQGNIAHDTGDAGNPIKIGAIAIAHGTNPTAVAAADRTNVYSNRAGIPFVIGGHPNIITAEYRATTAQTNDDILGAIGAGTKYVITMIAVAADKANTVDVGVRIGFGTSTVPAEPADGASITGMVLSHPGIAAGSGIVLGNGAGIIGIGGDGEELRITNEVPTTGSIKVIVSYFTIES